MTSTVSGRASGSGVFAAAGWLEGFKCEYEEAKIDPRRRDGLYAGPSRGHIDSQKAEVIGMARAYGYGATMGASAPLACANAYLSMPSLAGITATGGSAVPTTTPAIDGWSS